MSYFTNATLMITGGTGSFGSTVLKHFLNSDLKEIRIFSRDEKKQDDMRHELQAKHPEHAKKVKFYIGDVRNPQSVRDAMPGVDYIFHAADVYKRQPGIPSEYEKYINYAASESEADWAYAIDTILQPEQYAKYTEKARKARECVLVTKTWKRQVEQVLTQMKKQGIEII